MKTTTSPEAAPPAAPRSGAAPPAAPASSPAPRAAAPRPSAQGGGSELESRKVAESARETQWTAPSFMRELFLGNFRFDLIHPNPAEGRAERPEFRAYCDRLREFLLANADPAGIDESGEYPPELVQGLRKLGAFGMKIPTEYGGLGFSQSEYSQVMELLGSFDGNISALLSAHQSIGLPQPLKMFGTPEQKKKYLPRCAAG
ncbi:MAG TPA: acyl-CoA dehydrogenase family protein, partial [Candidatus Udaeobacter sp.]|nr:acyl-CoA dehydrogenase family protein [Candidatus Udaeobacter sp.]